MEGLVKVISKVTFGVLAVAATGTVALNVYCFFNGPISFSWHKHRIAWKPTPDGRRQPWNKVFHIFSVETGPGKNNIDTDLQYIVDDDTEVANAAICKVCGAHEDNIVMRKN